MGISPLVNELDTELRAPLTALAENTAQSFMRAHYKDPDSEREMDKTLEKLGGAATIAISAVFGSVSLPEGLKERLSTAIIEAAHTAAEGDFINTGNGLRSGRHNQEEDEEEKRKKELENRIEAFISEQERAREWAETVHSFNDTHLTGEQWSALGRELDNPQSKEREKLIEKTQKETGVTRAEAEHGAKLAAKVAHAYSKPGGTTSPEGIAAAKACNEDKACPVMVKQGGVSGFITSVADGATHLANGAAEAIGIKKKSESAPAAHDATAAPAKTAATSTPSTSAAKNDSWHLPTTADVGNAFSSAANFVQGKGFTPTAAPAATPAPAPHK